MPNRLVYGISFTVFCLSLVALSFLSRKPFCISSKLVQRIDRVDKTSTKTLFQCNLGIRSDFDENLRNYRDSVESELRSLESFYNWVGGSFPTIQINILEYQQDIFRQQGNQLFVSQSLFESRQLVSSALIKLWVQNLTEGRLPIGSLLNESLADFISYQVSGSLNLNKSFSKSFQPRDKIIDALFASRWPRLLLGKQTYCKSRWRFEGDISFCKSDQESLGFVLQSLRPIITMSLIQSLDEMTISEKVNFYRRLPDFVKAQRPPSNLVGVNLQEPLSAKDLAVMLEQIKNSIRNADYRLTENQKFAKQFELQLANNGFVGPDKPLKIDQLIEIPLITDALSQEIKNYSMKHPELTVALLSQGQLMILPNQDSVAVSLIGNFESNKKIWVRCQMPSTKQVLENSHNVEKLLIVNQCGDGQLNLISYLNKGAEGFALSNQAAAFMSLHIPSLQLALNHSKQSPIELIAGNLWKGLQINNLSWKRPVFDEKIGAFKILSEINAVDYFRGESTNNKAK